MIASSRILGISVVVATLAACGGAIAPSSSDQGGGGDGGGGGSDGSPPTTNDDGGTPPQPVPTPSQCGNGPTMIMPALRMCVPEVVQFDAPLTLTVGVDNAGFHCVTCTATVESDNTIDIEVTGDPCGPNDTCDDMNLPVACPIPALISGLYTVKFLHGSSEAQVQIDATSGGPTSCELAPAQPVDASSYPNSCATDSDCAFVYTGDTCGGCLCPNVAISASALGQYQNDFAAQAAECPLEAGLPQTGCGCPAGGRPHCVDNTCQIVPFSNGG